MEPPQLYTACKLTLGLPLSPAWSGHELEGARAALDDMLLKYNADIGAVLIAYGKLAFAADGTAEPEDGGGAYLRTHTAAPVAVGRIFDEHPVVHVRVSMEALLFTPRLGELLTGRVNIVGPGHVACLVAGLFNAAVLGDDLAGGYEYDDADGSPKWRASSAHAAAKAAAEEATAAVSASAAASTAADIGKKRKRADAAAAAAAGAGVKYNRILALNPDVLAAGSEVTFRLKSLSHAGGIISMHGSFVDPALASSASSSSSSSAAAGGAGAGAGAGATSSSSSGDGPRAVPTPTSKGSAAHSAASAAGGKSGKKAAASAAKPPEAKRWRADDDGDDADGSAGAGAGAGAGAAVEGGEPEETAAPAAAAATSSKKDKKEKKEKAEKSAKKDKSRA